MTIDKILARINIIISWIERNIMILSAFSITFLTFLSAINRYFFRLSLPWIQEVTIIFYMFLVFYGASNVESNNSHLRVTYFETKLINNPKISFFQRLYVETVSLIILCMGVFFGIIMIMTTTRKTTYLALPFSVILSVTFLFGFILYTFRVFSKIYFLNSKEK